MGVGVQYLAAGMEGDGFGVRAGVGSGVGARDLRGRSIGGGRGGGEDRLDFWVGQVFCEWFLRTVVNVWEEGAAIDGAVRCGKLALGLW